MSPLHNHIILIGFKHAGKSIIGKNLAKKLNITFIDLDKIIETTYENNFKQKKTCRKIMQDKGIDFFRYIETQALSKTVLKPPAIISLGGGTPLTADNQRLIKPNILIHIKAPKGVVYERILMNGRPAFINSADNLFESFNRLWHERMAVYENIQDFSIINNHTIQESVKQITKKLNLREDI